MNTYILEIGLEEMPANAILPAVEQLSTKIKETCQKHGLAFKSLQTFSTPRRLAVLVKGLPDKQEDQLLEFKGPPAQIAKDENNNWSQAAQGFAKKNEVDLKELFIQPFKGKDFVFIRKEIKGQAASQIVKENLQEWITGLSFSKNMRWGEYKMKYIRPIRWLVSLWNAQILPVSLEMLQANNLLHGHRFLNPNPVVLPNAEQYLPLLASLHVMADHNQRRLSIVEQVNDLEKKHHFVVELEQDLLEEVTNLVEWPTVLLGSFEKKFLELPKEVLVTTMVTHQRYFPVYDSNGNLLPHFVTVRNGTTQNANVVVHGNEKVIRARLNDAQFFFQADQRHELSFFHEKTKRVVFFQNRGSVAQRTARIQALSAFIAQHLQLNEQQQATAKRIAELSKFDLQTQMVAEFPSLQGVMGAYYARLKGETPQVSQGILQHYYPRFSQDTIPQDLEIVVVALADKLDMLTTAFSLDLIPKGTGDPYALRRMAQGVLQIVLELELKLSIRASYTKALEILNNQQELHLEIPKIVDALDHFFKLRQRFFMQAAEVRYDLIDALLGGKELFPLQQLQLADSLKEHLETPKFKRAVEAIVRATNISKKQKDLIQLDESMLSELEEKTLWSQVKPLLATDLDLTHYLQTLFALEPSITVFFDKVMVMDKVPAKQQNRLFLCNAIANWSLRYIDLSQIVFLREAK